MLSQYGGEKDKKTLLFGNSIYLWAEYFLRFGNFIFLPVIVN